MSLYSISQTEKGSVNYDTWNIVIQAYTYTIERQELWGTFSTKRDQEINNNGGNGFVSNTYNTIII